MKESTKSGGKLRILGILAIIYGTLSLLFLVIGILLIVFLSQGSYFGSSGISSISSLFKFSTQSSVMTNLSLFSIIALLLQIIGMVTPFLWLAGGLGLLRKESWGRMILIATSILSLLSIPFGTIMGVIYLIFMFKSNVREEFKVPN